MPEVTSLQTKSHAKVNETGSKINEGTSSSPSIYVFLDIKSDEQNANVIVFSSITYTLVNSTDFTVLTKKSFNLKNSDVIVESMFQDLIQSLADAIHSTCILKKLPFTFVVLNGRDLRLKFIAFAKNIGAQLPNYLEYPTYFDVKKEFVKYQEENNLAPFN
jgi:hypothetical protein